MTGDPINADGTVNPAAFTVPGVGDLKNSNTLLGVDGIRGIQTGTLDEAGACLLFAADYAVGGETITIVGAVLGGTDHKSLNVAVRTLLADVEESFRVVSLTSAGQPFGTYTTPWGDTANLVATKDTSAVVWSARAVPSSVTADDVGVAQKGDDVGEVTFTVDGELISVPLELAKTIDDPGPWWRLTNPAAVL